MINTSFRNAAGTVPDRRGVFPGFGRESIQQFLCSLVEPFLIFLLFFAGFNRMLGSTYPMSFFAAGSYMPRTKVPMLMVEVVAENESRPPPHGPSSAVAAPAVCEAVYLLLLIDSELIAKE